MIIGCESFNLPDFVVKALADWEPFDRLIGVIVIAEDFECSAGVAATAAEVVAPRWMSDWRTDLRREEPISSALISIITLIKWRI